jgi:hypothetical protein
MLRMDQDEHIGQRIASKEVDPRARPYDRTPAELGRSIIPGCRQR